MSNIPALPAPNDIVAQIVPPADESRVCIGAGWRAPATDWSANPGVTEQSRVRIGAGWRLLPG